MPLTVPETLALLANAGDIRQVSPGAFIRTTVDHQHNIEVLAGRLSTSDRPLYAVSAELASGETLRGLLVVLDDRLLYVRTWLAGLRSLVGAEQRPSIVEVRLDSVESVAESAALLPFANTGSVVVVAAGSNVTFHVSKKLLAEAAAAIRSAWHSRRETRPSSSPAKGVGDQLSELARLFSSGLLSEAEFAAAKQKLLA